MSSPVLVNPLWFCNATTMPISAPISAHRRSASAPRLKASSSLPPGGVEPTNTRATGAPRNSPVSMPTRHFSISASIRSGNRPNSVEIGKLGTDSPLSNNIRRSCFK